MKTLRQELNRFAEALTIFGETIWYYRYHVTVGMAGLLAVGLWIVCVSFVMVNNVGAGLLMLGTPLVLFAISAGRIL